MIWCRFQKGNSISYGIVESLHLGDLLAVEITGIGTSTSRAAAQA
jgi:hypothetical protein